MTMKIRAGMALIAAVLLAFFAAAPAMAHSTPDKAPDTPRASEQSFAHMSDNGLENATLRNPTYGAHNGPDGIHPPGNP